MAAKPLPPSYPPYNRGKCRGNRVKSATLYFRHKFLTLPGFHPQAYELAASCQDSTVGEVKAAVLTEAGSASDLCSFLIRLSMALWKRYDRRSKLAFEAEHASWLLEVGPDCRHDHARARLRKVEAAISQAGG